MTHLVKYYPHNDLMSLAHYHRGIINEKDKNNNDDALALDCMSFLVSLAFAVEAFVNFVGNQKVTDWHERQPFRSKIQKIYRSVGGNLKPDEEPYETIETLKALRDSIAHGQPREEEVEIRSSDELWVELSPPWIDCLEVRFINHAYDQVKRWQDELLELANIPIEKTVSSADVVL